MLRKRKEANQVKYHKVTGEGRSNGNQNYLTPDEADFLAAVSRTTIINKSAAIMHHALGMERKTGRSKESSEQ